LIIRIMKNLRTITLITMLLCMLVFILTILDFTALHDIKQDYVSRYILNYLKINRNCSAIPLPNAVIKYHLQMYPE
jgi:hypothetical protein